MERDEVFVPYTRTESGFNVQLDHDSDDGDRFFDLIGDTAPYQVLLLIRQQLLGWPVYLLTNVSSQRHYPKGTNHFDRAYPAHLHLKLRLNTRSS